MNARGANQLLLRARVIAVTTTSGANGSHAESKMSNIGTSGIRLCGHHLVSAGPNHLR